jgi:mRNA-degrading endonuclease RelE of RelBE toxin-antitoxin system
MSYNVIPSEKFKKEAKRLIKKFPSLKQELSNLGKLLSKNPESGTALGNSTYKIRVAIKSKWKGKSGGARVITYLISENEEVYLLTIYDKSEFDSIDDKIIKSIIKTLVPNN